MNRNPIFICDDEQEILRYLKKLFEIQGMKVETFSSGSSLMSRLRDPQGPAPKLLIQDIQLGDENGIEITREVKTIEPDLPVIVMTAYNSAETETRAMKAGAQGYLAKPFPKERILEIVESI